MRFRLIRSATLRLRYAGVEILIDPYLAPRHSRPSIAGVSPNPLVDLPCPPDDVITGADLVIVSHLHSDHFDPEAQRRLPRDVPILCQPGDEERIREHGFRDVTPVEDALAWRGIAITRTEGQHGTGEVLREMGPVSGFVFRAAGERTLYWAGDTIWCPPVRAAIERHTPEVIVTHSSGATWRGGAVIVMDAAQTIAVCRAAPQSVVVATHLESLDHGRVSRADLRAAAEAAGVGRERMRIPADGETLAL